jgi:hypothetical protein
MEHAEAEHTEHAGHGAAMVADMFRRFIVSILLSLPLVIFSPLGATVGLDRSVNGCGSGSWGGRRPSLAPYVAGTGSRARRTPPESASVGYALGWRRLVDAVGIVSAL